MNRNLIILEILYLSLPVILSATRFLLDKFNNLTLEVIIIATICIIYTIGGLILFEKTRKTN